MTGADVKIEFEREIFKAYSAFYNVTKQNALLRKALVLSLEDRYNNLIEQKVFDDMGEVLKLNKPFSLNNNQIYTAPLDIASISRVGTTFLITTVRPHNINVGDWITLANVLNFVTPLNGNYAVQQSVFVTNPVFEFAVIENYTGGTYTAKTGQVVNHYELNGLNKMAADYNHLLAVKAKFELTLPYGVSDVTNSNPIAIVLTTINNNIVTNDQVSVSGVLNNTNANGYFYVQKVNRKTFNLFIDKDLSNATLGNGDFQGLPVLKRVFYNFCAPLISIEKISNYDKATLEKPLFERGDKMIKIGPYDAVCSEITMDYVSSAVVFIDVNDNVIDLLDTYPNDFIYYVITKGVQLFSEEVNDSEKYKTSSIEIQEDNK